MKYSMSVHLNNDDLIRAVGYNKSHGYKGTEGESEVHYLRIGDVGDSIDVFLTVTQLRALKASVGNYLNDWELAQLPRS